MSRGVHDGPATLGALRGGYRQHKGSRWATIVDLFIAQGKVIRFEENDKLLQNPSYYYLAYRLKRSQRMSIVAMALYASMTQDERAGTSREELQQKWDEMSINERTEALSSYRSTIEADIELNTWLNSKKEER